METKETTKRNIAIAFSLLLGMCFCNVIAQNPLNYTLAKNCIVHISPRVKVSDVNELNTWSEYGKTVVYYDGLGRKTQELTAHGSCDGDEDCDLANFYEYNNRGKLSRQWVNVISDYNSGDYLDLIDVQRNVVNTYPNENLCFTSYTYEISPESRLIESHSPGPWQNHEGIKSKHRRNSNSVQYKCEHYFIGPDGQLHHDRYRESGSLSVTVTTDEDGKQTMEFVDKDNRKVLTRQNTGASYTDTHYVYDMYGNLCYVLPPEASSLLHNVSGAISDSNDDLAKFAYIYKYDHRNRCIEKKLPGCSPVRYVYDRCDNLVYSQDGNQRANGQWAFIAYDALGRVAYSGVTSERRTAAQLRDAFQNLSPRVCLDAQQELGYTRVYENVSASDIKVVNYYDNYDFLDKFAFGDSLQYMPMVNFDEKYVNTMHPQLSAKGLQTGSMARTLDAAGTPLVKSIYYDYHGNVIQSHENNLLGGFDHEFLHLTFTGKPLTALHQHSTDSCYSSDIYTYTYDNLERLLTTAVAHDGAAAVTLCSNTYDALGRLASSTVNNGGNRTAYSYNVRGWTQSVTNNHFYEWLHYQDAPSGGTPCYNGNISGITWLQRESMKAATSVESKYSYSYDGLNRLTQAAYSHVSDLEEDEDDWNGDLITYNERNFCCSYTYDLNGNMTNLQRYGVNFYNTSMSTHFRNYGLIDNLTMNYSGNQLTSVTDQCSALTYAGAMDFCDRTNRNDEYTYDANGNMTRDRNKGIHSITYNMLNLPQTILFNDGHETRYTYAADGRKLRVQYLLNNFAIFDGEEAEDGGEDGAEMMPFSMASTNDFVVSGGSHNDFEESVTTMMVRDYCGNKEYRNGVLDKIHNDYGYWHDGGYFFYVKDYRGDVRVVLDQNNQPVELNSYYPYGSLMAATTAEGVQSRKYGTKELDRENGLDWYDSQARMLMSDLGRTTTMDPLSEKYYSMSPYMWCEGNSVKNIDVHGDSTILFATYLPGVNNFLLNNKYGPTHTFIAVQDKNGKWIHFAYGSEFDGIRGAFCGRLMQVDYSDDLKIMSGQLQERVKNRIPIDPPRKRDGSKMSVREFDQAVIDVANSFGNNPEITYYMLPGEMTEGNCNTSSSTILFRAGVSDRTIRQYRSQINGMVAGFGNYRPWTAPEQKKAVENKYKLYRRKTNGLF